MREVFDNPQNKAIIASYAVLNLEKIYFWKRNGGYKSLNLMKICKIY